MLLKKNRVREYPTFANINLLGKCNANCFFCLGKDIECELSKYDMNHVHFSKWDNFEKFLSLCQMANIKNLYITGQNTDSLLYEYLDELIDYLKGRGFNVGLRTNGFLAKLKLSILNKCTRSVGYSIHTLRHSTQKKILGHSFIPNWKYLLTHTNESRVAIVVNDYNIDEVFDIIRFVSQFKNVKYIQMRRISTDTRYDELKSHIETYERLYKVVSSVFPLVGRFYDAEIYRILGKDVLFWRTVETSVNSYNYFVDGTVSKEYFVVEGYLKNKDNK